MLKYTRVSLKIGTENCDRKFFRDKKVQKKSLGTKNKIL
jgi:hypothetical protein